MQIPNLLNMAMSIVGMQQFTWYRFLSRADNGVGIDVTQYESPLLISGQVQAVPRNLYEKYGLDFQRKYVTFFISRDTLDVERDVSGDQIKYNNSTYQCLSNTDWFEINGWSSIMAVQI